MKSVGAEVIIEPFAASRRLDSTHRADRAFRRARRRRERRAACRERAAARPVCPRVVAAAPSPLPRRRGARARAWPPPPPHGGGAKRALRRRRQHPGWIEREGWRRAARASQAPRIARHSTQCARPLEHATALMENTRVLVRLYSLEMRFEWAFNTGNGDAALFLSCERGAHRHTVFRTKPLRFRAE